jgi:hypothetical protein
MSLHQLLSRVSSFAARTPSDADEILEVLQLLIDIVQQQFEAYLVDVVWETGQGRRTELKVVKMRERESHGYNSRPIYAGGDKGGPPNSLTAWCYERAEPIWIVDPKGLKRKLEYRNLWSGHASTIPPNTIYEYNQSEKIRTEICYPLSTSVDPDWRRAAGVLNIELCDLVYPTAFGRQFVQDASSVIQQLQHRSLSFRNASSYSKDALEKFRDLKAKIIKDEPGFVPSAFVALPMSTPGAKNMRKWIESTLKLRGIKCTWPETAAEITDRIWENIRTSHFGIVVSTGFNKNVLLEWGFLLGCRKPVIRLHSIHGDGEKDPFDVATVQKWMLNSPGEEVTEASVVEVLNNALDVLIRTNKELREVIYIRPEPAADDNAE